MWLRHGTAYVALGLITCAAAASDDRSRARTAAAWICGAGTRTARAHQCVHQGP